MTEQEIMAQRKIDLYNKLVKHIKSKGDGRGMKTEDGKGVGYSAILCKIAGIDHAVVSRMLSGGTKSNASHIPTYEKLVILDNCLERADAAFGDIKVNMSWGTRTKVKPIRIG